MTLKALCSLSVAVLTAAASAAQPPTFSSKVDAVRIDVLVTDRGEVVRGLGATDFEVRDNGVPQHVELVSFDQVPLDVVLALDLSDSVAGNRLLDLKGASRALIDTLAPADQGALLSFNHSVSLRSPLTKDIEQLRDALVDISASGDTSLYDGTYAAMRVGEKGPGRDLMVVFSDGRDTASWLSADQVVESARRADIVAYGLTLRGSASGQFLQKLAEQTGGEAFELESTRDLRARFLSILEGFRQRYLISYSPTGVPRGGWHRLDVRLKGRRAAVRARPGYFDR